MLAKLCIKRPVLAIVISTVMVLIGLLGVGQLQVRDMPKVFRPALYITVTVPGASAQAVEQSITTPLENSLQDIDNISYMYSDSRQNYAEIDLHFKDMSTEDFVTAQAEVQSAISHTKLPENANQPEVRQAGSGGDQALVFAIEAPNMSQQELVAYVHNHVVKAMQQVPGVGMVNQWSTANALRVSLNPKKMALLGITSDDIVSALQAANLNLQGGQIVNAQQTIGINIQSKLPNISAFQNLVIKQVNDRAIRLSEVANVYLGHSNFTGAYTYLNGKQGVAVSVNASDNANPITLGDQLQAKLKKMNQSMPPGMSVHTIWNQSKLLKSSVHEVGVTIFEALILVALITLIFLGRWRFALIPVVTIPVCIIAAFAIMWLLGFSINLLTLLALVLAVGLVIDDAIVVLENAHRHLKPGVSATQATVKSMTQIVFPVIGMTVSIIAVYLPVIFMKGKTAVYFQQFSFSLAGAVLISGIVALTLTPMMCARLMTNTKGGYEAKVYHFFERLRYHYSKVLTWVVRHRTVPISIFVLALIAGYFCFKALPSTLIPTEYAGYGFMGIEAPNTASVAYTEKVAKMAIKKALDTGMVDAIMSFGGGTRNSNNFGMNIIRYKDAYSSSKKNEEAAAKLTSLFKDLKTASIFSVPMNVMGGNRGGNPGELDFYLSGDVSYPQMVHAAAQLEKALKTSPMIQSVGNDTEFSDQQYDLNINLPLANRLQVPVIDINQTLSVMLGGYTISDGYEYNGEQYPLMVQLPAEDLKDLSILQSMYVYNIEGIPISLNRLVTIKPTMSLPKLIHYNATRAGQMNLVANNGYTDGQVVNTLMSTAKRILPADMSIQFDQQTLDIIKGAHHMALIFALGLLFIYLVLAALFESLIDPLIILFTVPLCIIGALVTLICVGGSLNIYTGIGLVTLIGLVSKHGVLITHFANEKLAQGMAIEQAVIEAASVRLRPILMTTATMTLGALPLVIASGIGSNGRMQLGCVIVAGLIIGTLFSLFVVPVAYVIFGRFKKPVTAIEAIE